VKERLLPFFILFFSLPKGLSIMTDIEILKKAYQIENPNGDGQLFGAWQSFQVGASRQDINRLTAGGMIEACHRERNGVNSFNLYKLAPKGVDLVRSYLEEDEEFHVTAADVLKTMDIVIGFDDIKLQIAHLVESRRRAHVIMHGPPACAKSVILEAIRNAVPRSYLAFGTRTSAAGLSDILFERMPAVLCFDEIDKATKDTCSVLLGLMQSGEIIETKSRKTRGMVLNTQVFAACNEYEKFKPELKSRFIPFHFSAYTREEFIEVCIGYLAKLENCPLDIAAMIGRMVYDYSLGDVRKGRQVWQLMNSPSEAEVERVIQLMLKYGPDVGSRRELVKSRKRLL
jgi:hypothetical protein